MATFSVTSAEAHHVFTDKKRVPQRSLRDFIPLLMIIVVLSITLLGFLYLSTFNHLSSQGVLINDLERQRSDLMIENEVWNMRISRLKSLDVIEQQNVVKTMVNVDPKEVEFIDLQALNQLR